MARLIEQITIAAGVLVAMLWLWLTLTGCNTIPGDPGLPYEPAPPHYGDDIVDEDAPLPEALAVPDDGAYWLVQTTDGRWRYERTEEGWNPRVRYVPHAGDPRIPWRAASTLEVW